jgi:hypothetical protein
VVLELRELRDERGEERKKERERKTNTSNNNFLPPLSGHTLRLLQFPTTLQKGLDKLMSFKSAIGKIERERERRERKKERKVSIKKNHFSGRFFETGKNKTETHSTPPSLSLLFPPPKTNSLTSKAAPWPLWAPYWAPRQTCRTP